jgi:membrane-bound lytic murein transglycosylase B
MTACLLASCSGTGTSEPEAGPDASIAPTPSANTPDDPVRGLPTVPARHAAPLARQLDLAAATLRKPDATPPDVRRAAEFQQLAVRALAMAPAAFQQGVTSRLPAGTARSTRTDVRAAGLLRAMTTPQRTLPHWRIVSPPPPAELLRYYKRAQRRTGVPWTHLAAIHLVETRMGRIRGTSSAGAKGPMQFLPSTWDLYGAGGDINEPRDAILAAARLLKHHGAPGDMAGALWHYNPSHNYVAAVLAYARNMRRSAAAYDAYWHWRVLYRLKAGTRVLPTGYPRKPAVPLPGD